MYFALFLAVFAAGLQPAYLASADGTTTVATADATGLIAPTVTTTTVAAVTKLPPSRYVDVLEYISESESRTEVIPGSHYEFPSDTYLVVKEVVCDTPVYHIATVIYLGGMEDAGHVELQNLRQESLFSGMQENVRLVAPVIADSTLNPDRGWFPFLFETWDDFEGSLATRASLEESGEVLQVIIDSEAKRLRGDYSRIFLAGYSQGAMMAAWIGLMSDKPLGGIVGISGGFPLFDVDKVSDAGSQVVFHHLHDPHDIYVNYKYAEKGLVAAKAAGARGYTEIHRTEIPNDFHHGLSSEVVEEANAWLVTRLRIDGLL